MAIYLAIIGSYTVRIHIHEPTPQRSSSGLTRGMMTNTLAGKGNLIKNQGKKECKNGGITEILDPNHHRLSCLRLQTQSWYQ